MLLRHLGQMSPAMQARFIKAGEPPEGLTADEQLEVASQLTLAVLASRHRFEGSQGDRRAYVRALQSSRGVVHDRVPGAAVQVGAVSRADTHAKTGGEPGTLHGTQAPPNQLPNPTNPHIDAGKAEEEAAVYGPCFP